MEHESATELRERVNQLTAENRQLKRLMVQIEEKDSDRVQDEEEELRSNVPRSHLYRRVIVLEDAPRLIDDRENMWACCINPTDDVHSFFNKIKMADDFTSPIVLIAATMDTISSAALVMSLLGFYPVLGYVSLVAVPSIIWEFMQVNKRLLRAVLNTFECWALIAVSTVAMGCTVDIVLDEPARIVAACVAYLQILEVCLFDAKTPLPRKNRYLGINMLFGAIICWSFIICWYAGAWKNVRYTRIPLPGPFELDIPSIGFSAFTTDAVLFSRYAYLSFATKEPNACVVLKGSVFYRRIDDPDRPMSVAPLSNLAVTSTKDVLASDAV